MSLFRDLLIEKKRRKYYCEVEYVESTGTQYIDTGYKLTNASDIEIILSADTMIGSNIFGSRVSATDRCITLVCANNTTYSIDFNSSNYTDYRCMPPGNVGIKYKAVLNKNIRAFYNMYGTLVSSNTTICNDVFTCNTNAYLFNASGNMYYNNLFNGKIYYCKIWDNGNLVRDFIPVLDWDMTPCMYDKVSGRLFYNAGTGDFLYGREIHYVDYLESTGTQWIDIGTNINTATDDVEMYFQITETEKYKWIFGEHDNNARLGLGTGDGTNLRNVAYYNNTYKVNDTEMYNSKHYYKVDNTGVYLNGTKIANYANFSSTSNLYLFNLNLSSATYMCKGKIWSYKQKRNGVLIRDYLPAIDENGVGFMFDKVTHSCFLNAGTGAFKYPAREIEYIQSTGTQYIDTGVYLTNNHSVEIDYQLTSASQNRKGIFGGLVANGARHGALLSPSNSYLEAGYGSTNAYYQLGLPDTNRHVLKQEKNLLYFDGNLIYTFSTDTFTQNFSAPLMNFSFTNYNPASAKYYASKWLDGNTLVRDYIPAFKDGVAGMLDKENDVFYQNAGTGTFGVGKIIEPEYE